MVCYWMNSHSYDSRMHSGGSIAVDAAVDAAVIVDLTGDDVDDNTGELMFAQHTLFV